MKVQRDVGKQPGDNGTSKTLHQNRNDKMVNYSLSFNLTENLRRSFVTIKSGNVLVKMEINMKLNETDCKL